MKKIRIGELLSRTKECINIEDDQFYKRVTIRMYHKGVCLRDIEKGINIGTKSQFLARQGQFIMSRIDARNGAFGIVPDELGGAVITNDFLAFDVNHNLIDIEYFELFSQTPAFLDFCIRGSTGTTNRKRLKEELFLNFTITIPEKNEQVITIKKYKRFKTAYDTIREELKNQTELKWKLLQSILQEAVQGNLVPQDPNDEPAHLLIKKIQTEKERLIVEGKIKREKSLPEIVEDEIPYELPRGWEWVRLGEIGETQTGTTPPTNNPKFYNGGYPFIKPADISDKGINYRNESLSQSGINKGRLIRGGSVMMVCIGGSIGKAYFTDRDCSCNQQINTITPVASIEAKFIYYFVTSPYFYRMVLDRATGSATPIINKTKWETILFPLPPLIEQKRIIEKINKIMALCDEMEKNIIQAQMDSELLMRSVLQDAF